MSSDLEKEIDLGVFARLLWGGRWLSLSVAVAFAVIAGIAGLLTAKRYEATVILSPVSEEANNSKLGLLSSVTSQLGGLASLAGIGGTGGGLKAEEIATLQSEALTSAFITQNNLLPILYPGKARAADGGTAVAAPLAERADLWTANKLFAKKIRTVAENSKTGLVAFSITWTNAKQAADWANGLVKLTNTYLRDKAIAEAERNIEFLKKEASTTTVVELQQAIYSLMESEIKKEMLARGSEEYALKVIDPAVVPEEAAWPRKTLWVSTAFFGGLILSSGIVLARSRVTAT